MTNLSHNLVTKATLDEAAGKITKALAAAHLPSIAQSVMQFKKLGEMVLDKKDYF